MSTGQKSSTTLHGDDESGQQSTAQSGKIDKLWIKFVEIYIFFKFNHKFATEGVQKPIDNIWLLY